jgi:pyruvate,orthophosphate dikinase
MVLYVDQIAPALSFAEAAGHGPLLLGGKGSGLARMTSLGIPVPPGFTVTCESGRNFRRSGKLSDAVVRSIDEHLAELEQTLGRRLDDPARPLLVSVRSGAPVSMPGMMDTVLNVGLTPTTVAALATSSGDERFAWSCYRRFVDSYAHIVRGIPRADIEDALFDLDDDNDDHAAVELIRQITEDRTNQPIPNSARQQILESIGAVFRSWDSDRARTYREFRGIDDALCTAATIQAMVFGNLGETSGSGVAFTRDPSSGFPEAFGDILFNAQGEDVVNGENDAQPLALLDVRLPPTADELRRVLELIERDTRDLCEVEFTIEEGRLWILQTRVGLRSGRAAVRTAVDLVRAGVITEDEALGRITPAKLHAAADLTLQVPADADELGHGLAASPGAAHGMAVFDPARARDLAETGRQVVLIRPTTSPSDVSGFIAATGIVTGRGGRTSHAAVVARGMNRPAVCGIGTIVIAPDGRSATINGRGVEEGTEVSVDGDGGALYMGQLPLVDSKVADEVTTVRQWARDRRQVPWLQPAEVASLPAVATPEAFTSASGPVVLTLDDPRTFPASKLAEVLRDNQGHAPVLRVSRGWLREADNALTGRVAALAGFADEDSTLPGVELLKAVLTHDG